MPPKLTPPPSRTKPMGKPKPPGPMPRVPAPWPKQDQLVRSGETVEVDTLIGAFAHGAIEVEEFEERVSDAIGIKRLGPKD